jgi:hypothetical protein
MDKDLLIFTLIGWSLMVLAVTPIHVPQPGSSFKSLTAFPSNNFHADVQASQSLRTLARVNKSTSATAFQETNKKLYGDIGLSSSNRTIQNISCALKSFKSPGGSQQLSSNITMVHIRPARITKQPLMPLRNHTNWPSSSILTSDNVGEKSGFKSEGSDRFRFSITTAFIVLFSFVWFVWKQG